MWACVEGGIHIVIPAKSTAPLFGPRGDALGRAGAMFLYREKGQKENEDQLQVEVIGSVARE